MIFSRNNLTIMETISLLRSATGSKILSHLKVEMMSAQFSDTKQIIPRQNWLAKNRADTWEAIRRAINGELPADHPVEVKIAAYAPTENRIYV